MTNNFGKACKSCGGEDCACCEVYLEWKADQRAHEKGEDYDPDDWHDEKDDIDEDNPYEENELDYEDDPDEDEDEEEET